MALIRCPECGAEVSDRATACPKCAFPIASSLPAGIVRIKMKPVQVSTGLSGKQRVTVYSGSSVLWEGQIGQIAELKIDKPTPVTIQYHMSLMHYGGECSGTIDPAKGKNYNVATRQGMFKSILELQRVDYIDAD